MLTAAEAKMRAAQLALEAVGAVKPAAWSPATEDSLAIALELKKIEDWLRRESVGNDKILLRQLSRETGRQVKPTAAQAKALGRTIKGRRR